METQFNNFEDESREVDLLEYWKVILKRRWVIVTFTGALVFFVGIFSFLATPIYKATTSIMIEEEGSGVMSIDETFGYQPQAYRDLRNFNTQLKLLQSKSLAMRVARKMNLLSRPEFGAGQKKRKSLLTAAKDILTLKWISSGKKDEERGSSSFRKDPYSDIAKSIMGSIDVSPVRETKLVELSYSSPHPALAAEIINRLAAEFKLFSVEKRSMTTEEASNFLNAQIANTQTEIESKEQELQRYSISKGLVFTEGNSNPVVKAFEDVSNAYTSAQLDRITWETNYNQLKDLEVATIPQFINNETLRQLRTDYIQARSELNKMLQSFREDYPGVKEQQGKVDSLEADLRDELNRAKEAARMNYEQALMKERSLAGTLAQKNRQVRDTQSNAVRYQTIQIEVECLRRLLNDLETKQSTTQVSARLSGTRTSNISIIDPAEVPESPVSPRKKMNVILALLIGLFGGVGLCFVLEYLDNTVKGPEDAEKMTGLPSLGVIPFLSPDGMKKKRYGYSQYTSAYRNMNPDSGGDQSDSKGREIPQITEIDLINLHHPTFFISEDYRTIRTSIMLSHADSPPKTITFTSALPAEGKTTSAANMAVSFAQSEQNVLVIDADLRKPRMHKIFNIRNVVGLSSFLTGKVPFEEAVIKSTADNVWVIPSGPIPPNPTELLNSKKMKEMMKEVKRDFDMVILDTPPVVAVVDPVIVASMSEGTVLVVQSGKTTEKPFIRAAEELNRVNAKILGILFNKAKVARDGSYAQGYQYHYKYHYYGRQDGAE